jgi:tRNA(Ile)-lysidine synthase
MGLEEAARQARYAFLERCRAEVGAAWIAVGHTRDDLAEDVVMRLVRGAGWPALGGMAGVDPARRLLRPLLLTARRDIEAFLRGLGVAWTEDASNADRSFLRNRVRLDVLPLLRRENPSLDQAMARLWRQARGDAARLEAELDALPWREEQGGALSLPLAALRELPEALRLRACKRALERIGPGQPLADSLRVLDQAVMSGQGGKTVQFPGAKTVGIGRGMIRFHPANRKR